MPFGYLPRQATWKDIIWKIFGYPSLIRRIQAPLLLRMLQIRGEDMILDAGCGAGHFSYEIAKRCRTCVGIDWVINSNLPFVLKNSSNLIFVRGDVQKLPFREEEFDRILLSSVLQMVEADQMLLKECYRVLKKDGALVLSIPTDYIFGRLNKLKRELIGKFGAKGKGFYSSDEIDRLLLEQGFEILELEYGPKKLGSIIYEAQLLFCYRLGLPLSSPFYFPLLYPIAYFDRLGGKKQKGTEILIKARKV